MEEIQIHALDYISVLQRRKWWLVVPAVLSVFVGLLLVRFLPKEYKSTTTLGVSAPVVSPTLVNPSASFDNEERLRAISQQLMSAPILERVVTEEKLESNAARDVQFARLRRAIEIYAPPTVPGAETRRFDTFIVSYSDEDPALAQRITNRLAQVFVDENSRSRTARAEDTSAFIGTQLRESQVRLASLEARLRKAKEAYMGQLPEQTPANLQTLAGLRQQLEANATTFRGEQDRLTMIERQITSLQQGRADVQLLARASGVGATSAEGRVADLERELTAAQRRYTDKHPEVQRLRSELEFAKKEAADPGRADAASKVEADPVYRQLMADRETTELRIGELQRAARDIQRQIVQYQARVEAAPMVEQQLATVQRDFNLEQQQYADLSNKLRNSSISEDVERNRSGEQFTVLYAASYPVTPTKPVPWRIMFMSIASGVCLGIALIVGREYFDRSVHDLRQLRDEFDLPILGEVTHIQTPAPISGHREAAA
jgi:polysaccharide chain length determinant protein (PEP-CTERM system associated)